MYALNIMLGQHYTMILNMLDLHDDVVDWNVDQFDEETDETHYCKSYRSRHSNLLKL